MAAPSPLRHLAIEAKPTRAGQKTRIFHADLLTVVAAPGLPRKEICLVVQHAARVSSHSTGSRGFATSTHQPAGKRTAKSK